jgi:hypothetical protein
MEYNGWSSYETWLCNLWIGDQLAEIRNVTPEIVETTVRDMADGCADGFISDLLESAISSINFHEIAEASKVEFEINQD